MTLEKHLSSVCSFHELIGERIASQPSLLPGDRDEAGQMAKELRTISNKFSEFSQNNLVSRAAMAVEELAEWLEAHVQENLVEAADALADRLFVLLGDAVATGLPVEAAFEFVSQSNHTKMASKRSGAGKGVKGSGFECPKEKLALLLKSSQ